MGIPCRAAHVVIWQNTEALTSSTKIGGKKHIKCHSHKPSGTSAASLSEEGTACLS